MKRLILLILLSALTACVSTPDRIRHELSEYFEVVENDDGTILYLSSLIFEFNSYALSESGKAKLDILGSFLTKPKNDDLLLYIKGHTDDFGDEAWNYKLGLDRAKAVRGSLISTGVNTDRMQVASGGESFPRAPNTSIENRQKNRRVEVLIYDQL